MLKRERLSIDVRPEEHRQIKALAALYGKTIREYVLECVRKRIKDEAGSVEANGIMAVEGEG